jgi:3-deoxy-D-manno-octulosonic-acid transferase
MLFFYNLLQIVFILFCLPCLVLVVLLVPKYRGRTLQRLGFGLAVLGRGLPAGRPRIWVHALSVGEVASVRPLVLGLRATYPQGVLILSVSTGSGQRYAEKVMSEAVDLLLPFPIDFYWSVSRFLKFLVPDLFILVETDLWPNFLAALRRRKIPAILVNGRVSAESLARYRRFRRFFADLFGVFSVLLMQSEDEVEKLATLGLAPEKLQALGNLKYDALLEGLERNVDGDSFAGLLQLLPGRTIWVAGSTHAGEEEVILPVFRQLRSSFPELYLVLAPRNPGRAREVTDLAVGLGLQVALRSTNADRPGDLLILDTMGELAELYRYSALAFIGGSLVEQRGHNPLEPAVFGCPVLFGPHMEDFAEIAREMLEAGAAQRILDGNELAEKLSQWLTDPEARKAAGRSGAVLVESRRGVTERHLDVIRRYLEVERRP